MKLYDKYKILKNEDDSKKYLFKSGNFYIFLDNDAKEISNYTPLKLTNFTETVKCGFPITSLKKYLEIFKKIGIDVIVIERHKDIIDEIKEQNLNNLSKIDLILIIERFINSV